MGKKSKKKGTARVRKNNGSKKEKVLLSSAWKLGDRVVVCGLKQATRFNGKNGTIISEPKDPGSRYGVSVDGYKIAVLASNLEASTEYSYKLEEKMRKQQLRNSVDTNSLTARRLTMDMYMTEEDQIKTYGRKIKPLPDFREELFMEGGGFPKGVDLQWSDSYLRTAFELNAQLPHGHEVIYKSKDYEPDDTQMLKRMGTNLPAKIKWFSERTRKLGDVFPQIAHSYPTNVRHSYSNQSYKKEILYLDTTHVAVGFVDLGILLEARLKGPPKRGKSAPGPLCFLGIERSPYAVAKTLVIWEMIRQSRQKDHLRYVMQVWFSTTFEAEAEEYLKKILMNLCDSNEKRHPEVDALLLHWRDADKMSLKTARSLWASRSTSECSYIAHFKRNQDRIDMAKYEITGDFGIENATGKPAYGNIVMLDCPDGAPPLWKNETVFSSLNWKTIASALSPDMTVFEASQRYVMERLLKVASLARQNMVKVNLVCDDVQNVTDLIAATKPWSISWSNVLDYIDYAEFHKLARACSIHGDTLHFGYSMNWPTNVLGVHLLDYGDAELRHHMIEAGNQCVDITYKQFGWENYLRLPPPTSPINSAAVALEEAYYGKWVDHFFGIGGRQGPCQLGNIEHALVSPLSPYGSSSLYLTWTYDTEIELTTNYKRQKWGYQ